MITVGQMFIGIGIALFGFAWQTGLAGVNRKIVGRLQRRHGPKWYQEYIDIFKLLSKRSVSHGWIFDFGVIMALGGIIATAMFMPLTSNFMAFSNSVTGAPYDNFFIFVYLLAVGMLGMAMSASGSGNPWASIGVMRALTTMLAYEVPFLVVVLTIIKVSGTSSISGIQLWQQMSGNHWFLIALPLGGIVGFLSLMGMLGKKPFETYIAPAEIASGPMVEYGGKQLGMLFILHEISVFIEVSLFVHLFLGGATNIFVYLLKYAAVYTFANLISNVNGRFKIDQVVKFFYKWPLLLAVTQAIVAIYFGWVI